LSEEEKINNKNYNLEVDVGMRIFCDVGLISSHLFFSSFIERPSVSHYSDGWVVSSYFIRLKFV
jgi:hypothetical protein